MSRKVKLIILVVIMGPLALPAAMMGSTMLTGVFNAREASKNRGFQRNMSNTQYQRAAADLEAAGLNRVLALGGGASTPSGSTATMPDLGTTGIQGYSAYQQAKKTKEEVNTHKEQQQLLKAQAKKTESETKLTDLEGDKQSVIKVLYQKYGEKAADLVDAIEGKTKEGINSAKDYMETLKHDRKQRKHWNELENKRKAFEDYNRRKQND
jgi:alcohol dehydrogenase class IV